MAKASTYKFTGASTDKLTKMAYLFYGIGEKDFPAFMPKHYPGLNLVAWVKG